MKLMHTDPHLGYSAVCSMAAIYQKTFWNKVVGGFYFIICFFFPDTAVKFYNLVN